MASINGLPPVIIPGTQRTNKSSNKRKVAKNQQQQAVGQTSKVANAVAHSIQNVKESDIHKAQIQYDLPEGQARRAMQEYMDVMNQAKREELAQLLGVDIYI
ncbi:chromosome partitioning protein ParA [Vibrio vulnificus]|uniref:chromosome partitioning protein ParA n=1 Tax=Vibrio vulnificus TaxID=672 RepID=UPI001A1E6DA8|nr:chromosome partitioning protein ParA [Vibrio vulnificus]MCU8315637.1 chromosome partitioning protein ParA [Vibrio vulnificus]HAS6221077.1 chromosome partitioning protein ParA [Vibrio vulnificus]HAT8529004.1 chromosome partitioning protein ParA [Vibrio vulnificus]